MLGKKLFIIVSLMSWIAISGQPVYAQLLEGRNKLKTVKRKGGFVLFQRKVKTSKPSGKHKTVYRNTPSSAKSTAGQNSDRYVNPRHSTRKHVERSVVINPRFTKPLSYGKTKPAGNRKKGFLPSFYIYKNPPKRKPGLNSQYAGIIKTKTPHKFHVGDHNQNVTRYSRYISKSHGKSPNADKVNYVRRIKNLKKRKNMHPSANYLSAKGNSPAIRDAKRKFNIVWVRMNENKIQPKATKRKAKKLKFDKDEKGIWNN